MSCDSALTLSVTGGSLRGSSGIRVGYRGASLGVVPSGADRVALCAETIEGLIAGREARR